MKSNESNCCWTMGKSVQSAFTLIELLVVIAIIAILGDAARPVQVQGTGRRYPVPQQPRAMSLGASMYAGDNRGYLMPNGDESYQPSITYLAGYRQWCPGREDELVPIEQCFYHGGASLPICQECRHL